jgi:hypothetical protein
MTPLNGHFNFFGEYQMNMQFKQICNLAAAISLALASNLASADGNAITFEGDVLSNGTGNSSNITSGGSNKSVSIYQLGDGTGVGAAQQNQVGTGAGANSLTLTGAGAATAHIGQGGTWNGTTWVKGQATKDNIIKGTIASGDVRINQNSNGNSVAMNINGSGVVTVNQGYNATSGSKGGVGFTADVTQTGAGTVTINQGNSSSSLASAGSATVIHAGSHTVAITQDRATAGSTGVVKTNTTGDGGSLTITQSNGGNTYVNAAGSTVNTDSATITGTAVLVNSGTGTVALTKAEGLVYANISGGNLTVSNTGAMNKVYVNAAGDSENAVAGMTGGDLTLASNGTGVGNTMKVQSFSAGTLAINQGASMQGSTLVLNGGSATSATINQNGNYQDVNVSSTNGSSGTFTLNQSGTSGAHMQIDLSI